MLHQLAVHAAIWGMPIVSMDAMRRAYRRDAQASEHDIVYFSKPADWKLQITTPNASSHYVYFNFNTQQGPVVLEIPPAKGAGLFGSIVDAWQAPSTDVGPDGADHGQGGKYLLLPPGYRGEVPDDVLPVPLDTFNGYACLRAIPESSSQADVDKALALVKRLRLYRRADAKQPPEQRFIDMAGKLFDGIVRFDPTFYESLARMVDEEPVLERDRAMLERLKALVSKRAKPSRRIQHCRPFSRARLEMHKPVSSAKLRWRAVRFGPTESGCGRIPTGSTADSGSRRTACSTWRRARCCFSWRAQFPRSWVRPPRISLRSSMRRASRSRGSIRITCVCRRMFLPGNSGR